MMMFKASIIIPVYNNPEELRLTIQSILRQTMLAEHLEVLVVDDGSEVDMKAIVEEFSDKIHIKYFYQEDKGFRPGVARNIGIREANGELCVFLDCGVILTSSCLEEHFHLYQENGNKIVIIGYIYGNDISSDLDEMRQIIDTHQSDEASKIMEKKGMLDGREDLYLEFGGVLSKWPAPWIVLWSLHFSVPTSFLRENEIYFDEFFNTWGCEDNDFGIQLQNHKAHYILGRNAKAIHYPPKVRSYDKLKKDKGFIDNFRKNQQYVMNKYPDNYAVKLWVEVGYKEVNRILIDNIKTTGQNTDFFNEREL